MKRSRKKRLSAGQKKLLTRIERLAKHAAVDRLRGDLAEAARVERNVDLLVADAEREHLAGAALEREIRGQQAADRLYPKVVSAHLRSRR